MRSRFAGNTFRVFNSRPLPEGKIRTGPTSRRMRGNWFLNIVIEMPDVQARPVRSGVGIDLGLKDFATLSTGEKLPNDRFGRRAAEKLAKAQRARKHKRHIAKLHAKVANARADFQHKLALDLVRRFDYIAVGNVSAAKLARTRMAKSVYDASHVVLPKQAPLQSDRARGHVRGSRRKRFDPVLFGVRIERQHGAAERYRGTENKRVGLQ